MAEIQKVKVVNQVPSLFINILSLVIWLLFIQSCTDACPKSENIIQCSGQISKQLKVEFDKGYSK